MNDFFADKDVCSIVLEVPNSALGSGKMGLWHRTVDGASGKWVQADRGALASQSVFLTGDEIAAYEAGQPSDDARFIAIFAHSLEHTGGYTPEAAKRAAGILLPDILLRFPASRRPTRSNGRTLTDDAIDVFLPILTNGKVTRDNVGHQLGASDCRIGAGAAVVWRYPAIPRLSRWGHLVRFAPGEIHQRYSHGLTAGVAYTYQKELTNGLNSNTSYLTPDAPLINDIFNPALDKQISGFDIPQELIINFSYTTPKWESGGGAAMHAVSWFARDWSLSGLLRYQSGQLIRTPASNNNLLTELGVGTGNNPALWGGGTTFQNRVPGQPLFLVDPNSHFDPTSQLVLNPAAWTDAQTGQFGASAPYYNDFRWQRQAASRSASAAFSESRKACRFRSAPNSRTSSTGCSTLCRRLSLESSAFPSPPLRQWL